MWSLSVPQWGRIFYGDIQQEASTHIYRPQPCDAERWASCLSMSATASAVLNSTESEIDFFRVEEDLALLIPKREWSECFYSWKNGFVAPNCPAKFIYFAKAIYRRYRICNLIGPLLPPDLVSSVKRKDYFGAGYTAQDAICNFVNPGFQPITEERLIVRCGNWYESYIPNIDMVVAFPLDVGKRLTVSDLQKMRLIPGKGLTLEGHPVSVLCGQQEVENKFYDLRGAV